MKEKLFSVVLILTLFCSVTAYSDESLLTGDQSLACQAIICLSSGTRPSECQPSLQRYFGISYRSFSDTINARINFLKKCPSSSQTPQMQALVNAIANGAGRCDTASLNQELQQVQTDGDGNIISFQISNQLPNYCTNYVNNSYVSFGVNMPVYVGDPARGGMWVNQSDYASSLAAYNARIAQEDAAAAAQRAAQDNQPY